MNEKYLNYEGLSTYNRKIKKYIQSRTPDATEDKKGLLKISDLPAYTSNRYTRFSEDFESGHYDEGEFQDIFSFLAKAADGTDYSTGEIPDSAVFPTYTVVIDGKVFENVECFHASDPWPFFSLEKVSSGDEMGFHVDYSAGTEYNHYSRFFTHTEEQGEEDSGILHHLEVYQENTEEIHKLDNKYLDISYDDLKDKPESLAPNMITSTEIDSLFGRGSWELVSASVSQSSTGTGEYLFKKTVGSDVSYILAEGPLDNLSAINVTVDDQNQVVTRGEAASEIITVTPNEVPQEYEIITVSDQWHDWRYETTFTIEDDLGDITLTGYSHITHIE